jgi:hypothetical protein
MLLVAMLLVFFFGCGRKPTEWEQSLPESPHPRAVAPLNHGPAAPLPDRSLAAEDYIRLGLPAFDRPWSGPDMATAAQVLTDLVANDVSQLPRYESPRSGKVFARLIAAEENLGVSRNKTLPLESRGANAGRYMLCANQVSKLYLGAFQRGKIGGRESIECVGAQLRTVMNMYAFMDEFLPTLDKSDPTYKTRLAGVDQMKQGLATTFAGCLQTLTERPLYQTVDLLRLLECMQETWPKLFHRLSAPARQEILVRLERTLSDPGMEELHSGVRRLQEKLQDATLKNKTP